MAVAGVVQGAWEVVIIEAEGEPLPVFMGLAMQPLQMVNKLWIQAKLTGLRAE